MHYIFISVDDLENFKTPGKKKLWMMCLDYFCGTSGKISTFSDGAESWETAYHDSTYIV